MTAPAAPSGPARPRVDYVVVAWGAGGQLGACLDSIAADLAPGDGVIVVDNASPDDAAAIAERHAVRPTVISTGRNLGFGVACNEALETTTAELVLFVNPDARLRPGATDRLVAALLADPVAVAAGPAILGPGGPSGAAAAGFEPGFRSALGHFLLLARVPGIGGWFPPLQLPPRSPARRVDWASAAALLVRTDALRRIGGFDPGLFLYMEDVDLCRRLREAGGVIRFEPSAVVEHVLGGSQGGDQARRWYDAFHAYVARRRGGPYARAVSAIAAIGLALRAVALAFRGSSEARRLTLAARTAARHVVTG